MVKNNFKFNLESSEVIDAYAKRINDEYEGGEIGYYHLPDMGLQELDKIYEYEKGLENIKSVVLIGIGGSSLGVKAIKTMLAGKTCKRDLYFLDNVDAISYKKVKEKINFEQSLFIISSKSGTTIETITIFKCLLDDYKVQDLSKNFLIITDPDTNLQKFAEENSIKFFNMPTNVGGRFSVLSAIGLVPLCICGYDVSELLKGALECKKLYIDEGERSLIAKAYHYATHREARINVVFSYSDAFCDFNDWYKQLWAESLGKRKGYKRVGLTPVGLVGSRDQHSFLQLIMDGPKDKSATFIKLIDHEAPEQIPNLRLNG
ncbi:MAG: glucose-6-phosphate isomerase, partial [Campylobacter sp.]|nr:glucose-6-phosphate isomerase [Campylobacter sp.]